MPEYSQEQLDAMVIVFSRGLDGADIAHMYNLLGRVEYEHISTLEERLRHVLINTIKNREETGREILTLHFESLAEEEAKGCDAFMRECCIDVFFRDLEVFNITLQDAYTLYTQQTA